MPETVAVHHKEGTQVHARARATGGEAGAIAAAAVPATVTHGTTGATAMFLAIAHGDTDRPVAARIGAVDR